MQPLAAQVGRWLVPLLATILIAANALGQPRPEPPTRQTTIGVITNVNLLRKGVSFKRPAESIYGTSSVNDYCPLADKPLIILDGKPTELSKLRADMIVAFDIDPKSHRATVVDVTSKELHEKQQLELKKRKERIAAFESSVKLGHDKAVKEHAARAFAKDREAYEAAMRAQMAAAREQYEQLRRSRGVGISLPGMPGFGSLGNLPGQVRGSSIGGKLVGIAVIHFAKVIYDLGLDVDSRLKAKGLQKLRDMGIEEVLREAFPDVKPIFLRTAARLIGMVADGTLSIRGATLQTAQDEVIELLKQEHPDIGNVVELVVVVAEAVLNVRRLLGG